MRCNKVCLAVALVMVCAVSVTDSCAEPAVSDDDTAIRGLIAKINLAWRCDNGRDVMASVLSEKSFAFALQKPNMPTQAAVADRNAFLNGLEQILKTNRPLKHTHTIRSITIVGPLAYECGLIEQTAKDGKQTEENVMLFFAKEDVGWRLVFSSFVDSIETAIGQFKSAKTEATKQSG